MRNVSVISTKDHLLFIIFGDHVGDELTQSSLIHNEFGGGTDQAPSFGNNSTGHLGFGIQGSANVFYLNGSNWTPYFSAAMPHLYYQYPHTFRNVIGIAATSNNSAFLTVVAKDSSNTHNWEKVETAVEPSRATTVTSNVVQQQLHQQEQKQQHQQHQQRQQPTTTKKHNNEDNLETTRPSQT